MPRFSPILNEETLKKAAEKIEVPSKATAPVDDMRYPGYASVMSDERLVTDYRTHCAVNAAPPMYGNSLRTWLQHNGDAVAQISRQRQAERVGALYHKANTGLGAQEYQTCDEFDCKFTPSGVFKGLGLERVEHVPELFGTFGEPIKNAPPGDTPLTTVFEGGRNSIRGREFESLGLKSFNPRSSKYGSSG
jgi:hypothetical protein